MLKKIVRKFSVGKYREILKGWRKHRRAFWDGQLRSSRLSNKLHFSAGDLYDKVHAETSPVFVLSTGRCGTKLLTHILEFDKGNRVYHQPYPEFTHYSGYAFQHWQSKSQELKTMVDACRYEAIRDSYILGERYIETNNRITFFAHQLATLYPGAKFIHLVRDPLKYIESGYSRNWYSGEKIIDEGHAAPTSGSVVPWDEYDQVQKITWLWLATNRFISNFSEKYPGRVFLMKSEVLYTDIEKVKEMYAFLELPFNHENKIRRMMSRPVNAQPGRTRKSLDEKQLTKVREMLDNDGYRIN